MQPPVRLPPLLKVVFFFAFLQDWAPVVGFSSKLYRREQLLLECARVGKDQRAALLRRKRTSIASMHAQSLWGEGSGFSPQRAREYIFGERTRRGNGARAGCWTLWCSKKQSDEQNHRDLAARGSCAHRKPGLLVELASLNVLITII